MKIKYKPWAKGLMYLVEAVVIILSVFPILWVVMSSFKTNGEILSSPLALPAHFSLDTFIEIFQKYSFPTYFFNSLLAAGVSTLVSLLFYAMGAYVIAKFEFPGRKLLFALFTITLLVPSHSKTQPIFSLIMKLNLYDSIWGVTLVYLSAGMANCHLNFTAAHSVEQRVHFVLAVKVPGKFVFLRAVYLVGGVHIDQVCFHCVFQGAVDNRMIVNDRIGLHTLQLFPIKCLDMNRFQVAQRNAEISKVRNDPAGAQHVLSA